MLTFEIKLKRDNQVVLIYEFNALTPKFEWTAPPYSSIVEIIDNKEYHLTHFEYKPTIVIRK